PTLGRAYRPAHPANPAAVRFPRSSGAIRSTAPSVAAGCQQPAGDDSGLDLAGSLEDVEDSCVTQYPADRIFECEAVAAMDLQRVVGRRPGDPGGQQLGHAGLDVAAPVA